MEIAMSQTEFNTRIIKKFLFSIAIRDEGLHTTTNFDLTSVFCRRYQEESYTMHKFFRHNKNLT